MWLLHNSQIAFSKNAVANHYCIFFTTNTLKY